MKQHFTERKYILMRVLESKGMQMVLATHDEIKQLTALGKKLDHDIDERLMIVKPQHIKIGCED